jgi:hypothetical protein
MTGRSRADAILANHRKQLRLMRALAGPQTLALCQLAAHGPSFFQMTNAKWTGFACGGPTADTTMRSLIKRRLVRTSKPPRPARDLRCVQLTREGAAFVDWLKLMVPR